MPVHTLHPAFCRVCQLRDTSPLIHSKQPANPACPWNR